MAGLGDGHGPSDGQTWDEHSHWQDVQHDRRFLNENCPRDPMIVALPLMELRNLAIDPQLARAMQVLYEDMARRYLEMSALLRAYVAQHRRKAAPEPRPAEDPAEAAARAGDEPRGRPGKGRP